MAPVQNTFSIVPNFPSANNRDDGDSAERASRPAMTTKQAKKAYQKANRGPKLSKAEIRRQELLEQDRIRKEAEKERNQARARVARDRKREKEDNERAAKKRKGLPLVNVRPSQDTIARFIRGFGAPKSTDTSTKTTPAQSPACSPPESPSCSPENPPENQPVITQTESPVLAVTNPPDHCRDRSVSPPTEASTVPLPASCPSSARLAHDNPSAPIDVTTDVVVDCVRPQAARKHQTQDLDKPPSPKRQRRDQAFEQATSLEIQPHKGTPKTVQDQEPISVDLSASIMSGGQDGTDVAKESVSAPSDVMPMTFSQELEDIADILTADYLNDSFGSIFASPQTKPVVSGGGFGVVKPTLPATSQSNQAVPPQRKPDPIHAKAAEPTHIVSAATAAQHAPHDFRNSGSMAGSNTRPHISLSLQLDNAMAMDHRPVFEHPKAPGSRQSAKDSTTASVTKMQERNQRPPRAPMAPPPIPLKDSQRLSTQTKSGNTSSHVRRSSNISSNSFATPPLAKVSTSKTMGPPPSTQAFVLDHFDDLFPSPSQEINEVYNEGTTKKGVCSVSKSARLQANKRFQPLRATQPSSLKGFSSSRPPLRGMSANSSRVKSDGFAKPTITKPPPVAKPGVTKVYPDFDFPFLSTQDVSLSFEDIEELETPVCSIQPRSTNSAKSAQPISMPRLPHAAHLPAVPQKRQSTAGLPSDQISGSSYSSKAKSVRGPPQTSGSDRSQKSNRAPKPQHNERSETTAGMSREDRAVVPCQDYATAKRRPTQADQAVERHSMDQPKRLEIPAISCDVDRGTRNPHEPFFTSSCRQPLYKYAIEHSKTSAWTPKGAGVRSETALDLLQQLENERFVTLLEETDPFAGLADSSSSCDQIQVDQQPGPMLRIEAEQSFGNRPQSTNGLSGASADKPRAASRLITKKEARPSEKPGRVLSSYEKMLAELDKTNKENTNASRTNDDGVPPSGSQETDYGDMGWDDEMLALEMAG